MFVDDPVAGGFVASLARPDGNITGVALNNLDVVAKRLQLLREAVPKMKRVAMLVNEANPAFTKLQVMATSTAVTHTRAGRPARAPTPCAPPTSRASRRTDDHEVAIGLHPRRDRPQDVGFIEHIDVVVDRPPLAQDRVRLRPDGRVLVALKTVWRDGTSRFLFEPIEFLEKLAAIIPRPAVNLVAYHGVLAPRARWRSQVVSYGRPELSLNAHEVDASPRGASPRPPGPGPR
jgi:hypothetical protein